MPEENKEPLPPSRREFIVRTAQGACAGALVYSAADSQMLSVTRLRIPMERLPSEFAGFKIGFASDFHLGPAVPAATLRRAVELLNGAKPDVVLLGGDYVDEDSELVKRCMEILSGLRAREGVYSVQGNHDYWVGSGSYSAALAESTSIKDLSKRGFAVRRSSGVLWIAGIDDNWGGNPDFSASIAGAPEGAPRVVFTHNPTLADELPEGYADLILAGHTHGWQIYVPWITRLFMPLESMRKYRAGFYKTKAGLMYVSRGAGVIYPFIRLWCSPEVVLITLIPA